MKMESIQYDIVVIGSGPGGLTAALAAARHGAHVLLVEKNGYLGGNLTIGLPLLGFLDKDGNQMIRGIAQEFVDTLMEMGACGGHHWCPMHDSVTIYDHEVFKIVALKKCLDAGIELLLHTQVIDTNVENGRIKSVTLFGKGRRIEAYAKIFIDATGDGDVGYMAGARYEMGQVKTGVLQPPTLMCTLDGVDVDEIIDYLDEHPEEMDQDDSVEVYPGYDGKYFRENHDNHVLVGFRKMFLDLKARGISPVEPDTIIYIETLTKGRVNLNFTRHLGIDGSDLRDLTKCEIEGHLQILKLIDVLRQYMPGFENCTLVRIFPFIGVRESRRFLGQKYLQEPAILNGDIGEDSIGLGSYIIDIHDGVGESCIAKKVKPYGLPYGMTVSRDIDNLMLSGRCASMDAVVMSSARVMPTIMVMGQGAGTGAALAIKHNIDPADVDVQEIRQLLREDDVMLEPSPDAKVMEF